MLIAEHATVGSIVNSIFNPPTLSACERPSRIICLFLPLYVLFMLSLIPFSFGSTPLNYSLGFLSEFTLRSYIVVVVVVAWKPLPCPSLVATQGVLGEGSRGGGGADEPRVSNL